MNHARLHTLELCAGYGGLGMGVKLARPDARVVAMVEREAACVQVLASRMEEGLLDPAPIFSDVCSFDGRPWAGAVDLISAGIPCQPWSTAGKRAGFDDERHLGEELVRIVGEVGPRYVFVENVPGFIRLGAPDLLGRLADLGFDAEWGVLSSCTFGSPHPRRRMFMLAHSRREREGWSEPGRRERSRWSGAPDLDGARKAFRGPTRPCQVGTLDAPAGWLDRCRSLGNGVDPLVAAHAWLSLSQRITAQGT